MKSKTGEMYFGGVNGFNVFHPDSIKDNPFIPPVCITDLQIFNKAVTIGEEGSPLQTHISQTKEITLSYKESVFSFGFTALNYILPEKNEYAYKMEGFDKDWNYVGNLRKATYTNLDPGEYTFRVKASNNDGIWNEKGTSIKITITPPFWKTWWFQSLVALTIIGSALSFYRVRINTIKAQKAELERQVQERTADLQQANEELTEQKEEILQQREEIEGQRDNLQRINEHVMSSIQYANTIQKAILPSLSKIQAVLPNSFILYRPKDVVSGDFYWFTHLKKEDTHQESDITFIAVIDCTGHGVPGAFMSIIGNTLLNEIINLKHILDPATILDQLNAGVKQAVDKSEGINTAGMDVCLCRIQYGEANQIRLLYGGAKRNLLLVRKGNNEIETLEADRLSIGSETKAGKSFATKELLLEEGTVLYLSSDGYTDQNNPQREKLGSAKFKQLITAHHQLSLTEQKLYFEKALDKHQQEAEQRDDITLIGVRV